MPVYYLCIRQPTLDRPELSGAMGSYTAQGALGRETFRERMPGAGRRLAGSDGQSELEGSSAFLLSKWSIGELL